jgi:adenylate cyclase
VRRFKSLYNSKGDSNETGMSRFEWEKKIPIEEAEKLLLLCEKDRQIRFEVKIKPHL